MPVSEVLQGDQTSLAIRREPRGRASVLAVGFLAARRLHRRFTRHPHVAPPEKCHSAPMA